MSSIVPNDTNEPLSHFKALKRLGEGKFSKVVLAESVPSKTKYAIKIIKQHDKPTINYQSYNSLSRIQNEIRIMRLLDDFDHQYILKLFNVITNNKEIDSYNQNRIYLVLEYCSLGELSYKNVSNINTGLKIFRQVVLAVEFLHANRIVHRDIKPSNILINESGDIKLSDFGVSYLMTGDQSVDQFELSSSLGTPLFMPPELCTFKDITPAELKNGSCKLDFKIDIWSLGITFYWLIFHKFPFYSDNEFKLFNKIVQEPLHFDSFNSCVMFNDSSNDKEYSHGQQITSFTEICNLLEKMLVKNPARRFDIERVKKSMALSFALSDRDKKKFLKFNDFYKIHEPKSHLNSLESAFSKLILKRKQPKSHKPVPPPLEILDQKPYMQSHLPDLTLFQPQPEDDIVSILESSSSSLQLAEDSDFDFKVSGSTHQLFTYKPSIPEPLNNSCFSLPVIDHRLSDNTVLSSYSASKSAPSMESDQLPKPQFVSNDGTNSTPITPLSPMYTAQFTQQETNSSQMKSDLDNLPMPRSKGVHNLSKMTASRGLPDLHSVIANEK